MNALLEEAGLASFVPAFEAAGETKVALLRREQQADAVAFNQVRIEL